MKKLPIGIQTFEEIIRDNYLYIDKTKYIYDLVENGKVYFLSRPRRFGKSVLISTLEALYKNKKELFKSLWIEKTAYNWQEYPVIRIDFSALSNTNADELDYSIKNKLLNIALDYNIDLKEKNVLKIIFEELIRKLSKINKVVVLIDEYDKPIIDNILNKKIAIKNRAVLKNFYGTLKPCDEYLKFVLLTGVSKFSQVSIFSDLNNLNDITMSTNCVKLVGCTEEELEEYFKDYITKLAEGNNVSYGEIREKIKYWYNGFRFSREKTAVYNPFSLLLLFNHLEFQNYWFETATPTFLLNLIKEHNYDIRDLDNKEVDSFSFSSYEVDNLQVLPLLYQTGYLTIKGYRDDRMLYTLGYPNFEVEDSFIRHLVALFSRIENTQINNYIWKCIDYLAASDIEDFIQTLKIFFANIPYEIQLKDEKYYQSLFHVVFTLIGLKINSEVSTNQGRIDTMIETEKKIYIFEFKLQGTAEEALNQIIEKQYHQPYLDTGKEIILVGVEFNKKTRNIGKYVYKKV